MARIEAETGGSLAFIAFATGFAVADTIGGNYRAAAIMEAVGLGVPFLAYVLKRRLFPEYRATGRSLRRGDGARK